MGKEQLEKAKKILNHIKGYGVYDGNDDMEIFEWLIEQAERVQELEDAIADYAYEIGKRKRALNKKNEQNKRYREALEFYADEETYEPSEVQVGAVTKEGYKILKYKYDPIINTDKGKKARQALEGEK